jgi:hypothetical protein
VDIASTGPAENIDQEAIRIAEGGLGTRANITLQLPSCTLHLRYKAQPVNVLEHIHTYTVWAECRDFIYKNSVCTSQETHYVSATETNRLILFGETVAVYCENHTEHINTLCEQNCRVVLMLKRAVHIVTTVL